MITAATLTIEQIVSVKNATVRATLAGESTSEIEKLADACAVAMGTWESDSRTAARQIVADWLNAQPVTAEILDDEQIRRERERAWELFGDCSRALGPYRDADDVAGARARIAAAINGRAKR